MNYFNEVKSRSFNFLLCNFLSRTFLLLIYIKHILGGASVNYHMIAPMSKGLFHRAISQSGTLMNVWADPPRPGLAKMRAIRLADKMGCPIIDTNYEKIISCLRKVDAKKITEGMFDFFVS